MNDWRRHLKADPLPFLLATEEPAVRWWTLRDLLDRPAGRSRRRRRPRCLSRQRTGPRHPGRPAPRRLLGQAPAPLLAETHRHHLAARHPGRPGLFRRATSRSAAPAISSSPGKLAGRRLRHHPRTARRATPASPAASWPSFTASAWAATPPSPGPGTGWPPPSAPTAAGTAAPAPGSRASPAASSAPSRSWRPPPQPWRTPTAGAVRPPADLVRRGAAFLHGSPAGAAGRALLLPHPVGPPGLPQSLVRRRRRRRAPGRLRLRHHATTAWPPPWSASPPCRTPTVPGTTAASWASAARPSTTLGGPASPAPGSHCARPEPSSAPAPP